MRSGRRVLLAGLAAAAATGLAPASASAGRLIATGHDADLHCAGGQQCHYFKVAVDYVRGGAPDPSKPVLVLDRLDLDVVRALDAAYPAGSVPRVVMDPRSGEFASASLDTGRYSAIIVASDTTCGGCDLNEYGSTPDSDAINARKADIEKFFNAGGGIFALSGASHGGNDDNTADDTYYSFVPLPLGGAAVAAPFTLTEDGQRLGFEDSTKGIGTNDDINCCATHNSFTLPPSGSALKIAETDSKGQAETLFAAGKIEGGTITPPSSAAPPKSKDVIVLPSAKKCVSRRRFRIRLVQPKNGEKLVVARVNVNGKLTPVVIRRVRYRQIRGRVLNFKRRLTAEVDLRGLPKGRFTVQIRAVTDATRVLRGTRKYRTCTGKRKGGRPKL